MLRAKTCQGQHVSDPQISNPSLPSSYAALSTHLQFIGYMLRLHLPNFISGYGAVVIKIPVITPKNPDEAWNLASAPQGANQEGFGNGPWGRELLQGWGFESTWPRIFTFLWLLLLFVYASVFLSALGWSGPLLFHAAAMYLFILTELCCPPSPHLIPPTKPSDVDFLINMTEALAMFEHLKASTPSFSTSSSPLSDQSV